MAVKTCPSCRARNTEPGDCLVCGADLGSLRVAIPTAFATSAGLALLWVGFTWLTGLAIGFFAIAFGLVVSLVTVHVSWGRGLFHQAVVSGATIVGLVLADATLCLLFWADYAPDWPDGEPPPSLTELVPTLLKWDPTTLLFAFLGVMGTFWVWRQGDVDSD